MIKEIKIFNFKGIKEADICFNDNKNIIVGDNGVGKSTILEALNLVLGIGLKQFEITPYTFHYSSIKEFEDFKILPKAIIEVYFEKDDALMRFSGKNNTKHSESFGIKLSFSCDTDYMPIFEKDKEKYKHIPCEFYRVDRTWFSDDPVKQFSVPFTTCVVDSSTSSFNNKSSNLATRIIDEELSNEEHIQVKG